MRVSSTALTGLADAQARLNVSASNVANVNTNGYQSARVNSVEAQGGGVETFVEAPSPRAELEAGSSVDYLAVNDVDIASETVAQIQAQNAFSANLSVLRSNNEIEGELIKTLG